MLQNIYALVWYLGEICFCVPNGNKFRTVTLPLLMWGNWCALVQRQLMQPKVNARRLIIVGEVKFIPGWTSDHDPRNPPNDVLCGSHPKTQADENKGLREKLAKKYMYTSSTQRYTSLKTSVVVKNLQHKFVVSLMAIWLDENFPWRIIGYGMKQFIGFTENLIHGPHGVCVNRSRWLRSNDERQS